MKKSEFLLLVTFFFSPLIMNSQQLVAKSSLTGTDLPRNTKKESRSTILNTSISRMDSFAVKNSFRVDKSFVEVLYTDADSLFNRFTKSGWTVTPIGETNFYDITKPKTQLLAFVDYSMVLSVNKLTGDAKMNRHYFRNASVIIIRRR